eukprot:TRINITY_DN7020_c0_g1_i1.p1 TRINITY_DN7020_c0_g1~~TRINITY_DN7020_c0_g1_i1.p1  ORF type:complete len:345 (+),score=79.27 TRINITY_DN7020_c0_g1_i1:36-1037(+)
MAEISPKSFKAALCTVLDAFTEGLNVDFFDNVVVDKFASNIDSKCIHCQNSFTFLESSFQKLLNRANQLKELVEIFENQFLPLAESAERVKKSITPNRISPLVDTPNLNLKLNNISTGTKSSTIPRLNLPLSSIKSIDFPSPEDSVILESNKRKNSLSKSNDENITFESTHINDSPCFDDSFQESELFNEENYQEDIVSSRVQLITPSRNQPPKAIHMSPWVKNKSDVESNCNSMEMTPNRNLNNHNTNNHNNNKKKNVYRYNLTGKENVNIQNLKQGKNTKRQLFSQSPVRQKFDKSSIDPYTEPATPFTKDMTASDKFGILEQLYIKTVKR